MVHALEIIHGLLEPGGILIDFHPTGEPPPVEVHADGRLVRAGLLQEADGFIEYFQADSALAEAVRRGLFAVEQEGTFEFLTHADTLADLLAYFANKYTDAVLDEATLQRTEAFLRAAQQEKEVVIRETIRIARLRRLG
jgi:hypothetical protein